MSGSSTAATRFEIPPTTRDGSVVGFVSDPSSGRGARPWILYLHGFGSSQQGEKAKFFRRRCLEQGLRFVSLDFQGHGDSGGTVRDLTVARCLRDVDRVRAHVDDARRGPPILMGSSMGGLVALWHATERQALAGAFIAPALGLDESFPALIGAEGMERWQESGILPITNELGTFDLGWGFVEDLRSRRPGDLLERHRLPTIIFQGKLDDRVSWQEVDSFVEETDASTRLVLFEDGDHRLIEQREVIWSETVDFWRQRGLVGPATRDGKTT